MKPRGGKRVFRIVIMCFIFVVLICFIIARKRKNTDDIFHGFNFSKLKVNRQHYAKLLPDALKKAHNQKFILLWYPANENKTSYTVDQEMCGDCDIIFDRSMIDDNATAAVIFDSTKIIPHRFPSSLSERRSSKLFIYWNRVNPVALAEKYGKNLNFEETFKFNATMGYRSDADFYFPHGDIQQMKQATKHDIEELIKMKSQIAVFFLPNCDETKGNLIRLQLVKDLLSKGLQLDAKGDCFPGGSYRAVMQDDIISLYKFYLAFEDSYHCKDFITEGFYRSLKLGTVPVVWGAKKEDYGKIAPPDSFIHVEDFQSTEELVQYLIFLDKNDTAYSQYFRWRYNSSNEHPMKARKMGFCQICREIHGIHVDDMHKESFDPSQMFRPLFAQQMSKRSLPSLKKWIIDEENHDCFLQPNKSKIII